MRWRYLILGMFVAVPVATVIHVWPQMPAYRIPGGRQYLADDPTQRQLLFLRDDRRIGLPPVIERYDADSGRLVSTVSLRLDSPDMKWLMTDTAVISSDLSSIAVFQRSVEERSSAIVMAGMIFDATTGDRVPGHFSFDKWGYKRFSPNGKSFALVDNVGMLAVIDTRSFRVLFESYSPTGNYVSTGFAFSPNSRQLLYQRHIGTEAERALHLINLETGQEEQSFRLPEGRMFYEWRPNEVRCFEHPHPETKRAPVRLYRHAIDGKTLGEGKADPILDCEVFTLSTPNFAFETESLVGQFQTTSPRRPVWADFLDKAESTIGFKLLNLADVPTYHGCVRVIERNNGHVRFEKDVAAPWQCRLAMDGKLLVVDTKSAGMKLTGMAPATPPPPPPPPFEIYHTDPWPRWIWTMLGIIAVMSLFAWIARWRHMAIRRRVTSPALAGPGPGMRPVV